MIGAVARKLFGSANDRRIRSYQPRVAAINALEPEVSELSDDALKARTDTFKKQIAEGASLDDLLVPAFATVREAAKRTLGQRHFDVQLIGGMILHEGKIAEMKTGEGKTLVATLPVYAIVDEVDSILIDEARTPLIISGPLDDRSDFYNTIDSYILKLDKSDYEVDEKQRTVTMTEAGMEKMEVMLRDAGLLKGGKLYDIENVSVVHHVNQALRAHKLFQRDKDYIVRNGEVVIIDEFTGRMMPGRRYSEGLHQALEAKEHQPIQPENQTLASITFQNYFRMYEKLAGMTGTAMTEADEFQDIYE